jgi:hypothetical protein
MDPGKREIFASQLFAVGAELDGKPVAESWWSGYHPQAYGKYISDDVLDYLTSRICQRLKNCSDIKERSLELQLWWREHQRADQEREQREEQEAILSVIREQALRKLTSQEKKALGL